VRQEFPTAPEIRANWENPGLVARDIGTTDGARRQTSPNVLVGQRRKTKLTEAALLNPNRIGSIKPSF
jgi:hypothetical protein